MEPTPQVTHHESAVPKGIRAEFTTAIEEEIAAIRRHDTAASFRVANGRFVGRIDHRFHYVFTLDLPIDLFWDGPAEFFSSDRSPVEIFLLSTCGFRLTASLPAFLGENIENGRIHYDPTAILKKWIERLGDDHPQPNPAGERLRGVVPISGKPASPALSEDLDFRQADAVASVLGHDAAFILTPAGTGKNRIIAEIIRISTEKNMSALVVSRTGRAADDIFREILERLPASCLENRGMVRIGEPHGPMSDRHAAMTIRFQAAATVDAGMKRLKRLMEERRTRERRSFEVSRLIELLTWLADKKDDLEEIDLNMLNLQEKKRLLEQRRHILKEMWKRVLFWREAAEEAKKIAKVEKEMIELTGRIASLTNEISDLQEKLDATVTKHLEARNLYDKTISAGWLSRQLRQLPTPEQQKGVIDNLGVKSDLLRRVIDDRKAILDVLEKDQQSHDDALKNFGLTYPGGQDEIRKQQTFCRKQYDVLNRQTRKLNKDYNDHRIVMAGLLSNRLRTLHGLALTQVAGGTPDMALNAIRKGYANALSETNGLNIDSLRFELSRLEQEIAAAGEKRQATLQEIGIAEADSHHGSSGHPDHGIHSDIDHGLDIGVNMRKSCIEKVEKRIISEAAVVVATLSHACFDEDVQSRRFDTVIIDQASMSPIPAVWIAAGLAASRSVVLGDPLQVPPAVHSDSSPARKWLGRSIFEASGFTNDATPSSCRIILHRRYDTNPEICALADDLRRPQETFEKNIPHETGTAVRQSDDDPLLTGWFEPAWDHDGAVVMIDTGPLRAWVTRVEGVDPDDRFNFISAALCIRLAAAVLRKDRKPLCPEDDPRMIIVALYASHATLLELLIRAEGLENDVRAVTPESLHAFRAPVVIVDLVEDDPYSGAPMFRPSHDPATLRRIHTFLAAAQSRLMIVGDFAYIEKRGRTTVAGGRFLPALNRRTAGISANDFIDSLGNGFAAENDDHPARRLVGDSRRSGATDLPTASMATFVGLLKKDIRTAATQVVLYSPELDASRVAELKKPLTAALKKGIRIYVVTRPAAERRKDERSSCRLLELTLAEWGITVIHQMKLQEKLVLIDRGIFWAGSFDPLGAGSLPDGVDFHGHMERLTGLEFIGYVIRKLRVDDLVSAYDGKRAPRCPICGGEIVAAAGRDRPYYWRCIEKGCYSRTIDQPPPAPVEENTVRCARCGGEVEFGTWGGKPCWRCLANRRHRQPIAETHLLTAETARRIPPRPRARLMKAFKIPSGSC